MYILYVELYWEVGYLETLGIVTWLTPNTDTWELSNQHNSFFSIGISFYFLISLNTSFHFLLKSSPPPTSLIPHYCSNLSTTTNIPSITSPCVLPSLWFNMESTRCFFWLIYILQTISCPSPLWKLLRPSHIDLTWPLTANDLYHLVNNQICLCDISCNVTIYFTHFTEKKTELKLTIWDMTWGSSFLLFLVYTACLLPPVTGIINSGNKELLELSKGGKCTQFWFYFLNICFWNLWQRQ